jgi:predicted enzyme involved in methoxymalonyl-ACP biosynthesis
MKIAVVGLGYVGLPLSLQFARWCVSVLGIDVDPKNVEDAMFATLASEARTMGVTSLRAVCVPTAKNLRCLQFLERSGFRRNVDGAIFSWNTTNLKPPGHIRLVGRVAAEALTDL